MKRNVDRNSEAQLTSAREEHDHLIRRLLEDPAKREAVEWLSSSHDGDGRTIGACKTKQDSLSLIRQIYGLGAVKVFAVNIHPHPQEATERTGKLVVELPQNPKLRQTIFDWCKGQGDSMGFTPDPDHGESHLFLLLD